MTLCKKCGETFAPVKGLLNYCSLKCRNSKEWTEADKLKKSYSAKNSEKVITANKKRSGRKIQTTNCLHCQEEIKFHYRKPSYHPNCWLKISGGYKPNSGRGKCGWYKGYWCQSTYELAFVIYNLEHEIVFERVRNYVEYEFDGKVSKYYPDFKIGNQLIEIKGFYTPQVLAKIQSVEDLVVYDKEGLKHVLDYVIQNYGNDFKSLYEGNPHNEMTNRCKNCDLPCKKKSVLSLGKLWEAYKL